MSKNRVILQYDLEGNFLREWESYTLAAIGIQLGIDSTDLSRAINNQIETAGNFQWRVQDRGRIPTRISQAYDVLGSRVEIKVAKYYSGRLISVYDSINEAAYKNRVSEADISRELSNPGTYSNIGGFTFKKIE